MESLWRLYLLPSGILAGTIIGAGIFSLPHVFQKAGFWVGVGFLALAALVYAVVHLMYADVIVRTPGKHRFVGYAKIYGGAGAYWLAVLIQVVQALFVLTVYLVLAPQFIKLLLPGADFLTSLLVFWVLGSLTIFLKIREVALFEFLVTGGMAAIIFFLFGLGIFDGNGGSALNFGITLPFLFLPLAPALFSMSGLVAVPSLVDYFNDVEHAKRHRSLKASVILGTAIPAVVYLLFVLAVVALSPAVSEDSVSGLVAVLSTPVLAAIGILGTISLLSSYLMIGLNVSNILRDDLRFARLSRIFIVVAGPLVIYFAGFQNFLTLVSFTGGIFIALEGLLMIYLWRRARSAQKTSVFLPRAGAAALVLPALVFAAAFLLSLLGSE